MRIQSVRRASLIAALTSAIVGTALTSAESLAQEGQEARREAGASIARSVPPPGATTHTVVIGERYGGTNRWLYGSDYRQLWTTPIEVDVLDLDAVGGGLTPVGTGGFGQSISLDFEGADGREYRVRSVDKDPTRRLLPELLETFIAGIVQDQIASLFPAGALVVDPLLEAAGILHVPHRLVVIPDDPRLGDYRDRFAGLIGMLVEHPQEGEDGTPGFAGSTRVSGTENFMDELEEGPCNRVDSRAFLKARLMDMVIGDRDRHAGQWRWARFPDGDCYRWETIPEDRDQAFVDYDGLVMGLFRRVRPQQITFGERSSSITGLTFNAWEVDRDFLVELEESDWTESVAEIQSRLPDNVIEDAVRRLPPAYYDIVGSRLTDVLKARRDDLGRVALEYYRRISRWAQIRATDADEYAEFEHLADGALEVRIGVLGSDGSRAAPHFRRTFTPDVTREVRVYLRGGDDLAEIQGADGRIKVRAIGGGGDDRFVNASSTGAGLTRFYDSRGDNRFDKGRGAGVDEEEYERPPGQDQAHQYALDWGGRGLSFPLLSYTPDLGLYAGFTYGHERYGFRKDPFKTQHFVQVGLASSGPEPLVTYNNRFRGALGRADLFFEIEYSGINVIRFHGFGNDSQLDADESSSFFKVEQKEFSLGFGPEWTWGDRGTGQGTGRTALRPVFAFGFGPVLRWSDTPLDNNADRFIGNLPEALYGTESFGEMGGRAWFTIDTRNSTAFPTRGLRIQAGGTVFPAIWDVDEVFGEIDGSASVYLTPGSGLGPTLALRAGGKHVFGDLIPFHEAAYVGGASDVRGYFESRYAGESAAFGNAELRFKLFRYNLLVPTDLGVFGVADAGRVWLDGDPSDADDWHTGFGGGLWWAFVGKQTLSVAIVNGDDRTGVYVRAGFLF